MKKILFIATQATDLGNGIPTGVWFEELSTPYYAFVDKGYSVDIATLNGGSVPFDPKSYTEGGGDNPESVENYMNDSEAKRKIEDSFKLEDIDFNGYDAIFLPGGHGCVIDLPNDQLLAEKLGEAYDKGKIVAAVCHGPAGLVNAKRADGNPIVEGKHVNSFTNSEEAIAEATEAVPFLLEDKLKELGGQFEHGSDFQPYAVRDRNLITGQNPASSLKVAELIIEALEEKQTEAA